MARLNVYVPDELAARAREAGLNVSKLTQQALDAALQRTAMQAWIDRVSAHPPLEEMPHELSLQILDEVRDEYGMKWEDADDGLGD